MILTRDRACRRQDELVARTDPFLNHIALWWFHPHPFARPSLHHVATLLGMKLHA